ncbi:MAG: hypothetical protein KJ015_23025, partial [Myxococcales bacterium]|nr:hypothetical protein [Myxococcales bacterium]
ARSTQHAARSTQHAARSTQHAARSIACLMAAGAILTVPVRAEAAFSWATCSTWPNGNYFPADIGSNETDRNLLDTSQYGLNEYQKQVPLLVNGNVGSVTFYYSSFNTELNYDFLKVEDLYGEYSYTGNLGTGSGLHYPKNVSTNSNQFFMWSWKSDYSIVQQSNPRFDGVRVYCKSSPQQTTAHASLSPNKRTEALLIASGDVIYTSVYQPANTRLILTADVLTSDDPAPDLDMYASTQTLLPDDASYEWRGYHGNGAGLDAAGEALDLGSELYPRMVFLGIRSFRGRMHVVLRPNLLRTAGTRTVTVCHPGVPNIEQHANWPNVRNTLQAMSVRLFAATHGNVFIKNIDMKYDPGTGGDKWCSSISGCDYCMPDPSVEPGDFCGMQAYIPGRIRIPHASCALYTSTTLLSRTLLHESLHGLFGLDHEYSATGAFCAHSVMNGPANNEHRLCLYVDHCKDAPGTPPQGFDCLATGNLWYRLQTGPNSSWFYDVPPQGPGQPTAQVWATGFTNTWTKNQVYFAFR